MSFKDEIKNSTALQIAYALLVVSIVLNVVILVTNCISKSSNRGGQGDLASWVNDNPQVILDSVNNYVRKMQDDQQGQQISAAKENIKKYKDELLKSKGQGVINAKGKKVIVEFFDYDCPYCRMAAKNTKELLAKRKDIKLILKPLVIHDSARKATEIGLAISKNYPAKFEAYYEGIMVDQQGQSSALIKSAVEKAGLNYADVEKLLEKDKSAINELISEARDNASKVNVNGTPSFIVFNSEGELIPGAVDANTLEQTIDR
ncbi:MAG: DsbA family protein [Rickettsiales bacterium]|jgi:protein-disulfide isomerase|nr:DsbA family protein [Rickettsiales bacterium]